MGCAVIQLTLDFDKTHREKALAWIDENPQAMALFERFALEMAARGRSFGIGFIAERVRWEAAVAWSGDFKVNNNFRAYIARELIRRHPHLSDLIECRHTKDEP